MNDRITCNTPSHRSLLITYFIQQYSIMAPPRASNRSGGGIWGFVLVFVCVIVTIDVLYIHQKGFRQTLESHGIGFSPPRPEQRPEKFPPVKNVAENMEDFKAAQEEQMKQAEEKESPDKEPEQKTEDSVHKVAGLSCKNYGGPSDEDAAEMVFWNDMLKVIHSVFLVA